MTHRTVALALVLLANGFLFSRLCDAVPIDPAPVATIRIDASHPWRPPFGLDRIGQPLAAIVEIAHAESSLEYSVVAYRDGKELVRSALTLDGPAPHVCPVSFDPRPSKLTVEARSADGATVELASLAVEPMPFEADAIARPKNIVNPVDLGAVFVPSNWLLLGEGQTGDIDIAAMSREGGNIAVRVSAWFESAPSKRTSTELTLAKDRRALASLAIPSLPEGLERDTLRVSIATTDGAELWRKTIPTMLVHRTGLLPEFGAVETCLRYDSPISVLAPDGGFSSIDYNNAWDKRLRDVVVSLPNGSRFVFWRGSSYIPFWAGRHNTGLSYEWAETSPPADGCDCVEPLMDKECRYGRVRVVEATPARVHVRWSYQSCDLNYKVWGDSAVEDFYFYRDGFGTRVLTLQRDPSIDYELSEFIVLTPPATYPLSVVPSKAVDILYLDGEKRELTLPYSTDSLRKGQLQAKPVRRFFEPTEPRGVAAMYRARLHKDDAMAAVYFNPLDLGLPGQVFGPFRDKGQIVTSCYWGSHWPLSRGKSTSWAIDDRIEVSPCHNSIMSWARNRPKPLQTAEYDTLDTLGRSKPMVVETWAWLIGMSDADDQRLLEWAKSFASPPGLAVEGARLETQSYVPERRAMRLVVEEPLVLITIKPQSVCVNPVFELAGAPKSLLAIELAGRPLREDEYAWDGQTLWINATLTTDTLLRLEFDRANF